MPIGMRKKEVKGPTGHKGGKMITLNGKYLS